MSSGYNFLPVTRALLDCDNSKLPSSQAFPTTLGSYQKQPVTPYLKKVAGHLKKPLKLFLDITDKLEFSLEIPSNHGIQQNRRNLSKTLHNKSMCYVEDALGILCQGYFQSKYLSKHFKEILLKNDENGLECELSSKSVRNLRKLKENAKELNKFLDWILLHYSSFSWTTLPSVKKVKSLAKKTCKAIKALPPERFNTSDLHEVTEEDILCSVLGLDDDAALWLKNLDKRMRQHRTDKYFLLCFIKEHDVSCNVENLRDTAVVEHALQKMSFTENRSSIVAKWISEQPIPEEKTLLTWAKIYIQNLFKYDIFLNNEVSRFPYKKRILDKWFVEKVNRANDDDDATEVHMINVITKNGSLNRVREKIDEYNTRKKPEDCLYFHGTDHESAKNILQNGIFLDEGDKACDFSHGHGFYVTDDLEYALDYAHSKVKAAAAVIIFNISYSVITRFRGLDLSGPDQRDNFKSVTKYFRSGKQQSNIPHRKLYNTINNADYISGPISRDGRASENNRWQRDVTQICIRKEDMASEFGKLPHILGIVFLNTENTRET